MGNAKGEGIQHFIPINGKDYDIIAIGLQESTYSMKDGDEVKDGSNASEGCIKHLASEFAAVLGKDFFVLEHARRAQMQLYVYARLNLQSAISNIEKSAENTGFLHIFPNKVCQPTRSILVHNILSFSDIYRWTRYVSYLHKTSSKFCHLPFSHSCTFILRLLLELSP